MRTPTTDIPAPFRLAVPESSEKPSQPLFEIPAVGSKDDFEPVPEIDAFHFKEACEQLVEDDARPKPRLAAQILSRLLGRKLTRQISNFFANWGFGPFFRAKRDYSVLPASCILKTSEGLPLQIKGQEQTAQLLAEYYKPVFSTIDASQTVDEETQVKQVHYEVLPPVQGKTNYTIIYYVERAREALPLPVLGKIYDWIRPVWYGSKEDIEPIRVDINRNTGEPEAVMYETSNYTGNSRSFDMISPQNLHLCTKVIKQADGSWLRTVYQKNGNAKSFTVANPFLNQLQMTFVSWNGLFDIREMIEKRGYRFDGDASQPKLYELPSAPLGFLDMNVYCQKGIDLRAPWLNDRKQGRAVLVMPPRTGHPTYQKRNLIGDRMPEVVQGSKEVSV